jgi:hypothetical protein
MPITHHQHEELSPAAVPLSEQEIREHLDEILAGDEFSSSRRASELLRHLVERALAGDAESLKERLLGVEIFHRRSDYNTSTDAIVRVTANDVRRRLAHFYTEHPSQPMRISLPLGSYVPDFIPLSPREPTVEPAAIELHPVHVAHEIGLFHADAALPAAPAQATAQPRFRFTKLALTIYCVTIALALWAGWWLRGRGHTSPAQDRAYVFYNDLLGPIGAGSPDSTDVALTNPHVLLYLGLNEPGPSLGSSTIDVPVPSDMAAVLDKTANDNQASFPYHHFFVDTSNYTGLGEATAAFGLARLLQATGRNAQLTEERFLNWEAARQEQLVILGAPHESKFVQSTLSAANFTIGYDSIHNAHPLAGEQPDYSKTRTSDVLEDYGLIWMTKSPSGTRILVLAGLSSAGTAGVGEFFSDPQRMWPVYQQLRAAAGSSVFPESWQVLLRIEARQDVPVNVTPVAIRITKGS